MALILTGLLSALAGFIAGVVVMRLQKLKRRPPTQDQAGSQTAVGDLPAIVVLTQDEWLHLCARRRIRLNHFRLMNSSNGDTSLHKAFSLAPFTKPADGSALLVLAIRSQWISTCALDPDTPSVGILELNDVLSHHLVSDRDRAYLTSKAASVGVEIDPISYEHQWHDWDGSRLDADARRTVVALARRLGRATGDESRWPLLQSSWFTGARRPKTSSPSIVERLVAAVGDLNEMSLANRESSAYYLQVAILWAERHGYEPRAVGPIGEDLRMTYAMSKQASWNNVSEVEVALSDTFAKLSGACPTAFTDEVSPFIVGVIARIICDGSDEQLSPDDLAGLLQATPTRSFPLVALVAVHTMTVEKINQLLLD